MQEVISCWKRKLLIFIIEGNSIRGVITSDNEKFKSPYVILATGHSARDIYEICQKQGIELEMKSICNGGKG